MAKEEKPKSRIITTLRTKLLEDRTIEFVKKSVTHQLNKDLLHFYSESIQQKQQILNDEKQKLEEIEEKIYDTGNDFCESIWKFSREHDFGDFLINYPKVKTPSACHCKFYKETMETTEKELQENAEIKQLTLEVDALKIELETLLNDSSLEKEKREASEELKFAYQEDHEIQRLYKLLQNSQQELEFLQAEIAKYSQKDDLLSRNSEINSSPAKKKKISTDKEKSFKKFNSFHKTSGEIENPPQNYQEIKGNEKKQSTYRTPKKVNFAPKTPKKTKNLPLLCPNTIDNYLILNQNKPNLTEKTTTQNEDKQVPDESKISNEIKEQDKPRILDSWKWNSDDISYSSIEDSIKEACTFLEKTKKNLPREILSKHSNNPEIKDFVKSEFLAPEPPSFKYSPIRPLVAEQKSISKSFTPKKQSAIAEKFSKALKMEVGIDYPK